MPARRCSTSSTCTAAASAGASTRRPTRRSTTRRPASTSTRRRSCRPRRASTPRPRAPVSPTTSRSRAAQAACSRPQASSCSTAISPRTTSPACGPSGASTTRSQPGLAALPDRTAPASAVTSAGLIGRTMPDGTTLTAANLDAWIRPQLPPQGVPQNDKDASVWNWAVDDSNPAAPVYLGEPEDTTDWADDNYTVPGHPTAYPRRRVQDAPGRDRRADRSSSSTRSTGASAFPLMRTHVGKRPPFSPNGHSGAPWLGETGDAAPPGDWTIAVGRPQGRHLPGRLPRPPLQHRLARRPAAAGDARGSRRSQRQDLRARTRRRRRARRPQAHPAAGDPRQHRRLRGRDAHEPAARCERPLGFLQVEHPHPPRAVRHPGLRRRRHRHVVRADGPPVSRPRTRRSPRRGRRAPRRSASSSVRSSRPASGSRRARATESIESARSRRSTPPRRRSRSTTPLANAHAAGEYAGVEFVQYRWYPDVQLDNIFFHDHVDGIHDWGHGLVGQLIVEPQGSTLSRPPDGSRGRLRHDRRHPHPGDPADPGRSSPPVSSTAASVRWRCGRSTRTRRSTRRSTSAPSRGPTGSRTTAIPRCCSALRPRRPVHAAAAGLRRRPVRDPDDQRERQRRHVARRRAPLLAREPLPDPANPGGSAARPIDTIHYGISERFSLIAKGGAGGPWPCPATTST